MSKTNWLAYRMWRSCSEKRKYDHEGQANREAFKQHMRAYKCKYCSGWHLTSKPITASKEQS